MSLRIRCGALYAASLTEQTAPMPKRGARWSRPQDKLMVADALMKICSVFRPPR